MVIPERALAFRRWLSPGRASNVSREGSDRSSFYLKNENENESGIFDNILMVSLFTCTSIQTKYIVINAVGDGQNGWIPYAFYPSMMVTPSLQLHRFL